MKLFLHDQRRDRVLAELELGNPPSGQMELAEKVIGFLENHRVLDDYATARFAECWRYKTTTDIFGEPDLEIEFY